MHPTSTPPHLLVMHCNDSEEEPSGSGSLQFAWMAMLYTHIAVQYGDHATVFVAANHLIYPVEGDNKTRQAPDVFVAFGRPKMERGSYRVWEEEDIFPQVIFEVWSPNNRFADMQDKFAFYEKYGAEEYYILYPEFPMFAEIFRREGEKLDRVEEVNGYVSPRTGLRFALSEGQLTVSGRDRQPLKTAEEQAAERKAEAKKAAKLAAKLRELGVDPDSV